MILTIFTAFHVILSLVGIVSGFVVVFGLLGSRRLDDALSLDYCSHQRYRSLIPISWLHSGLSSRNCVSDPFGDSDSRTLSSSPRGRLGADLRDRLRDCALSERVCSDCAALPESSRSEIDCSDTVRAAIPIRPACCALILRWTGNSRLHEVPRRAGDSVAADAIAADGLIAQTHDVIMVPPIGEKESANSGRRRAHGAGKTSIA